MKNRRSLFTRYSLSVTLAAFLLAGIAATGQGTPQSSPDNSQGGFHGPTGSKVPFTSVHAPDVLGDSMGVDFAPYFHDSVLPSVRRSWHSLIRQRGLAPSSSWKIVAEFTILKDGSLDGLTLAESSGDADADQTALDAIRNAGPFAALPAEFKGESLRLRCRMDVFLPSANGVTLPQLINPHAGAEYSETARRKHVEGTVLLSLLVTAEGKPTDIQVTRSVGSGLDEKAIEAVQQWRFHPAMKDGTPVAHTISVEVSFHMYK